MIEAQMENKIVEGNQMIAEFMQWGKKDLGIGFVPYKKYQIRWDIPIMQLDGLYTANLTKALHCNSEQLRFHESWCWLMPVIEKISAIKWGEDTDSPDTYYPRTFGMINSETGKPMFRFNLHVCFEADTLIKAAWLAVVDFLTD